MKNIIQIFLFTLIFQACGVTKNTDNKIFRNINLNKEYGTIYLDTQKNEFKNLIESRENRFFLKKHTFGKVESIELVFDNKNSLKKTIFSYPYDWDKNLRIQEYQNLLGVPTIKNGKTIWNDGKTQFEIYTKENITFSELTDL